MNKKKIGRLAMRHEGKFWNAYYASSDTMKDAVPIGSIGMVFVTGGEYQRKRKEAFMAFMQDCVSDIIEDQIGQRPEWPDGAQPAPESERSGHG
jgi:hypothetical protein